MALAIELSGTPLVGVERNENREKTHTEDFLRCKRVGVCKVGVIHVAVE